MVKRITLIGIILTMLLGGFSLPIAVEASPDTLTVQPSAKDAFLQEALPTLNNGGTEYILIVDKDGNRNTRSLLEFDISELPEGSTINSASLQLYYWDYGTDPVGKTTWAYKLTRTDWVELQATWNIYKTGENWTAAGGDYVTSDPAGGSTTFPADFGWMSWNVLAIAQDAYDGSNPVEILVKFETEGLADDTPAYFHSNDYTDDTDLCPKLVIDYSLPIPTVTTQAASSVTQTTAIGNGNITDTGGGNCTERGFDWDVDSGTPYANSVTTSGNYTAGAFTGSLTSLPVGTIIYYRAKAYNIGGWGYGEEITFNTLGAPTVTTVAATSVKKNSAQLNGNIVRVNGKNADKRGFEWGTATGNYTGNWTASGSFEAGIFNHTPTLVENTTYYFRAYAHNDYGWGYGSELSFETLGIALWFQPNEIIIGTTLPDRAGDNDGVITWGSNPANVSANLTSFSAEKESEVSTFTLASSYAILTGTPDTPGGMFVDGDYSKLPAAPINAILDEADVPRAAWWLPFLFLGICVIGFITYGATTMVRGPTGKLHEGQIDGSLLLMFVVMEASLAALGKMGPIPYWPTYLFPIAGVAIILSKKHFSWG